MLSAGRAVSCIRQGGITPAMDSEFRRGPRTQAPALPENRDPEMTRHEGRPMSGENLQALIDRAEENHSIINEQTEFKVTGTLNSVCFP